MTRLHTSIVLLGESEVRLGPAWSRYLRLSVRAFRDRHRIAHRVTVEDERSVVSADAGLELRDGFIGSHLEDLGAASNRVAGANRCLETPIHLKEYGARSREVFGHNRVEDCARYAPLYDNLAKPARLRHALIVMKGIPVSADLGEPFDILRVHRARALRNLPNAGDATRPDLIDVAAHKSPIGLDLPPSDVVLMLSSSLPHLSISTSSLSEPGAPAQPPRCFSRDEAFVCSRSTAVATGATRSRPTPSCAPALSNSLAGAF